MPMSMSLVTRVINIRQGAREREILRERHHRFNKSKKVGKSRVPRSVKRGPGDSFVFTENVMLVQAQGRGACAWQLFPPRYPTLRNTSRNTCSCSYGV